MSNGGIIGPVNDPIVSVASTTTAQSFTSSGTYTSGPQAKFINYVVVAGGGGGGNNGGGGGAGGLRSGTCFPVTIATAYPITIGAGGVGSPYSANAATSGNPSVFSTITSAGGGTSARNSTGNPGGSGGGGGGCGQAGGTGNTPPVSPPQGNPGGASFPSSPPGARYGGGGGASAAGTAGAADQGGPGGAGSDVTPIFGPGLPNSGVYGGGGGGGHNVTPTAPICKAGQGGPGGGGRGSIQEGTAVAGTANTGGGGGGGAGGCGVSAPGGSGIVIIQELTKTFAPGVWSLQCQYNFKKQGTWTPSAPFDVDYLVVAGGGGGGGQDGGGGGAGGFRTSFPGGTKLTLTGSTSFPVTVGAGGTAGSVPAKGGNGNPSIFSTITSTGGGGGGSSSGPLNVGNSGGSGGGSSYIFPGATGTFPASPLGNPAGNSPPVSPSQGSPGGYGQTIYPASNPSNWIIGGGGGGAGGAGTNGSSYGTVTPGGVGLANSISGSPIFYAGGGGGGGAQSVPGITGSIGGNGGGGNAASPTGDAEGGGTATAGTVNTGGGGGANGNGSPNVGAAGGSGIVIIRAPGNATFSVGPATNTITTLPAPAGGCKVATFTVSGTLTT